MLARRACVSAVITAGYHRRQSVRRAVTLRERFRIVSKTERFRRYLQPCSRCRLHVFGLPRATYASPLDALATHRDGGVQRDGRLETRIPTCPLRVYTLLQIDNYKWIMCEPERFRPCSDRTSSLQRSMSSIRFVNRSCPKRKWRNCRDKFVRAKIIDILVSSLYPHYDKLGNRECHRRTIARRDDAQ